MMCGVGGLGGRPKFSWPFRYATREPWKARDPRVHPVILCQDSGWSAERVSSGLHNFAKTYVGFVSHPIPIVEGSLYIRSLCLSF
jgi:hypothetical protein